MKRRLKKRKNNWLVDYSSVFLVGFVSMAIEIVGIRFVSPYLGTSTLVWSIFIAVVLLSMSLGSFVGGKLADKFIPREVIIGVIYGGISWLSLMLVFGDIYLKYLSSLQISHEYKSFLGIVLLFGVPFFLLSFITPLMMRVYLNNLRITGTTVGKIQAVSSLGNILGVLVSSFVFLNIFGTRLSLYYLIVSLCFVLLFQLKTYYKSTYKMYGWMGLVTLFLLGLFFIKNVGSDDSVILDTDSMYSRIQVVEGGGETPFYAIKTGYLGYQSKWPKEGDEVLYKPAIVFQELIENYSPTSENILLIGGGGLLLPKLIKDTKKDYQVDVVEIDPEIISVSEEVRIYNGLDSNIHYEDGRVFIKNSDDMYDVVIVDAFLGDNIPFHLITKEALEDYQSLIDDGLLVINIASGDLGYEDRYINSVFETLKNVYKNVEAFSIGSKVGVNKKINIFFVASNKLLSNQEGIGENSLYVNASKYLSDNGLILTDDFFPTRFTY